MTSFSYVLLFYLLPVVLCAYSDDLFPQNTSRAAQDWLPVAQCRADCLNAYGMFFGLTTTMKCNSDQGCLSCWQDCACDYFRPVPIWPQCSLPSTCFGGCRRAHTFFGTFNHSITDTTATNSWRLESDVQVFDGVTFMINNTLVDQFGRNYARKEHLVFSVAVFDGLIWIQLTQAVTFITTLNIRDTTPQCDEGCLLRTVAVNGSAVLARSDFTYVARRNVKIVLNRTLIADDSSLSVMLCWNLSTPSADALYELRWTRLDHAPTANNTVRPSQCGFHSFNGSDANPEYLFSKLFYNAVYDVTIVRNVSTLSLQFDYHFATPYCTQVIEGGLYCLDQPVSSMPIKLSTDLTTTIAIIGGLILAVVCVLILYILLRYRKRKNLLPEPIIRASDLEGVNRHSMRGAGVGGRAVLSGPSVQCETDRLLVLNFADLVHTPGQILSAAGPYIVTKGSFGGQDMAVKRLGVYPTEIEKKQRLIGLNQELTILASLRQHSSFIRVLGSATTGSGLAVLTKFVENSWQLDYFLQKFYRVPYNIKSDIRGTQLIPGGFGIAGAGFLRPLTSGDVITMTVHIASGLAYLTSRKIIHGAVCAGNILCNADFQVKIHGLSNASYLDETAKRLHFNERYARWLPLEVLKLRSAGIWMKTDVWSFGVVLWEILTLGCAPYPRGEVDWLIRFIESGSRLEQPPLCSDELYRFLMSCWTTDVAVRPSMLSVHEKLRDFSQRKVTNFDNLIKLGEAKRLGSLADTADALSHDGPDPDDLNDAVFDTDERHVSNENLVFNQKLPIGSLQRIIHAVGSLRTGVSQSPNSGRANC